MVERYRRVLLLAALTPFLTVLIAPQSIAQDWGVIEPGGWLTVPPADYPAANSVVVFDRSTIQVEIFSDYWSHPVLNMHRHIRLKALTRAGVDEIGNFQLEFREKSEIAGLEAQTLCPDGSVVPVEEKDMFIKKVGDMRLLTFAFPALDSGCVVEVRYETSEEYYLSYYIWEFSSNYYTCESRFTLELGCRCEYTYQTTNLPPGTRTPIEGLAEGIHTTERYPTYTWRVAKLPPIKEEPYMTCVEDYRARIMVRLAGIGRPWKEWTWEQMGKVYDDFVKDYLSLPRDFRETIRDITKGCDAKYAKSKAIYDYVVNNFETKQTAYRRTRHHKNMNGLWKERYGTAWEKNLLLLEMLRKARVDCWPMLICTRDHARFDPTWKEFHQFSHAIVFAEVEQGGIYLDASSKYCPYGTLPPVCRVDAGLLIDGFKSELMRVVTNVPKSYRLDQTTIHLDANGNAACSTDCRISGYLAAEFGGRYERMEPQKFVAEVVLDGLPTDPEVAGSTCAVDSSGRFNVEASYTVPGLATQVGSSVVAAVPDLMFGHNPFASEYRFTPVDFNYNFVYHHVVTVANDDSTVEVTPPEDVSFGIEGITFQRRSTVDGGTARVESIVAITQPLFAVEDYSLVREMFRRIELAATDPVVWKPAGE